MYLNQFSVVIPEGNETSGGYIEMQHGKQYVVRLRNDRSVACDAHVEIDGKNVGTWRLQARQNATLEHPVHDQGRFTFYRLGSVEAEQAQLSNSPNLGLVKVTFTPGYAPRPLSTPMVSYSSYSGQSVMRGAGGTGLSGHSNQHYGVAREIELDYSQQTVIHLRLIEASNVVRPLTQFSSPVPPLVYA